MSNADQYLGVFLAEMEEQLDLLNHSVLAMEQSDNDPEIVNRIFRVAHTLKGSSATMGFETVSDLTHKMENILSDVRNGKLRVDTGLVDILFACLDQLQTWRIALAAGSEDLEPATNLIAQIEYLGGEPKVEPSDLPKWVLTPATLEQSMSYSQQGWWIGSVEITIEKSCAMQGVRAYLAYSKAIELGEVLASTPEIDELSEGDYHGNIMLWIAVPNASDIEKLRSAIINIAEIESVVISPWSAEAEGLPIDTGTPEIMIDDVAATKQQDSGDFAGGLKSSPNEGNLPGRQSSERSKAAAEVDSSQGKPLEGNDYLRIEVSKLDVLMNLLGELVIDRARLNQIESELEIRNGGEVAESLSEVSRHVSLVTSELQERLLKLRMSPMSGVFGRLPRIVRDLSRQLGKDVNLVLEGEDTELDRTVIQNIFEPLIHLIRNAIDHGLETPEERRQLNKPPCGELLVKAEQLGGEILITVKDNGWGIQPDHIRRVAVERGMVSAQEAKVAKDADVIQWIFEPGFSTKNEVSEVSGRGVGMDIVRHKVDEMHGRIKVESAVGFGTTISVILPLTLAVVSALLVDVAGNSYTIPLGNVLEILQVPKQEVLNFGANSAVIVRGRTIPIIDLLEWCEVSLEQDDESPDISVVLVSTGLNQAGLIVSNFIGEQEVVVKPLDKYLGRVQGLAGATLLGDGRVSLILDVSALLQGIDVLHKQVG